MKNRNILFAVVVFGIFSACTSGPSTNNDAQKKEAGVVEDKIQEHSHKTNAGELSLNNGEKWQANPETNEGIANMQEAVESYQQAGTPDPDSLQMQLFSEFRTLVEKCTMKGEAHDQLHYYIIPLKKKIDALKEGDVQENITELEAYLMGYSDYFE